jgi:hypothetical protein
MTFLPMLAGVAAAVGSYMATPMVIPWARGRGLPVLRLLARVADDLRPNNAERVAQTLGAALRDRFDLVSSGCECGAPAGWQADPAAAPGARVASA